MNSNEVDLGTLGACLMFVGFVVISISVTTTNCFWGPLLFIGGIIVAVIGLLILLLRPK